MLLTSLATVLGFVLIGTGIHLFFVDTTSAALRLSQMIHVVCGFLLVIPGVMSLWRHWKIRGGSLVGHLSAIALLLTIVSGSIVVFAASAGYLGPDWVMPLHAGASVVFLAAVVWHTAVALKKRPKARWTSRYALPSAAALLAATGATGAASMLLASQPSVGPVTANYSKPFGENLFLPSNTAVVRDGLVDSAALTNSLACRDCHAEIYEQWSQSMHRHSATDPHVDTGIRWFQRDNGVEAGRFCAGCHNPIGLLAGQYDPSVTHEEIGTPPEEQGISCLVCHATVHVNDEPLGNGSFKLAVPDLAVKQGDWLSQTAILLDPKAHGAEMLTPVQRTPQFCGSCHQQYTPKSLGGKGPSAAHSQYVEWSESTYAEDGANRQTCNDCHMPLVPANDPSADEQGRVRSHRFLGANHSHAVASGYEKQAELQLQMLRSGLEFSVALVPSEKAGHLGVDVSLANVGVGHRFPSGTTDLSETWLEVSLVSAGTTWFLSGGLDERHYLDPEAKQWRTVFVDASNVPVDLHNLAIVDRTVIDDYLAPSERETTRYDIPVAASAPDTAELKVRLRMRKTNQRWNDWLTNFDGSTVNVTDIFESVRTVSLAELRGAGVTPKSRVAEGPSEPSPEGMRFVPSGSAIIGSEEGDADESPVRTVFVQGFHIDRYPVTNSQYQRFIRATKRSGPVHRLEWAEPYNWDGQNFPAGTGDRAAVLITHEEATQYCNWVGKRLPLEVEWEKAARGPLGQRYPWGESWDEGRCDAVNTQDIPRRVGMCPTRKSPYGVEDLVGSTWEWVQDYYRAYDRTHLHPNANEWITSFGDPSYALRGVPAGHAGPGTTGSSRAGHADNMRAKIGFRCAIDARTPEARGTVPETAEAPGTTRQEKRG